LGLLKRQGGGWFVTATAKVLGITVPVLLATTFCLTVPFILLVADVAILAAALVLFIGGRRDRRRARAEALLPLQADLS
jgi:hypothetical protein